MIKGKSLGLKYFIANQGDEVATSSVIRIIGNKEDDKTLIALNSKNKRVYDLDDKAMKKYTKLNPDAILMVSHVIYDGLDDIIITVHTMDNKNGEPSIICRQNIVDIHAAMAGRMNCIGMCSTVDNLPVGIKLEDVLAYDKMKEVQMMFLYNTDTIYDILNILNTKKVDKILRNLKQTYDWRSRGENEILDILGACSSLNQLLKENGFMTAFHEVMGIHEVPFSLMWEEKVPKKALQEAIIAITEDVPSRVFIRPYDKSINLNEIKRKYVLMTANPDKARENDLGIYIVSYDVDTSRSYIELKYKSIDKLKDNLYGQYHKG